MVENLQKKDNAMLRAIRNGSGKLTVVCDGFAQLCTTCDRLGLCSCPENNLQPPCIAEAIKRIETSDYPVSTESPYP